MARTAKSVDAVMAAAGLPLPVTTPPMEAHIAEDLPTGPDWQFEPKWDGFRCLAFRHGDEVDLRAKSGKPLGRYFPEMVEALRAIESDGFVVDGGTGHSGRRTCRPRGRDLQMLPASAGKPNPPTGGRTPALFIVVRLPGGLPASVTGNHCPAAAPHWRISTAWLAGTGSATALPLHDRAATGAEHAKPRERRDRRRCRQIARRTYEPGDAG